MYFRDQNRMMRIREVGMICFQRTAPRIESMVRWADEQAVLWHQHSGPESLDVVILPASSLCVMSTSLA